MCCGRSLLEGTLAGGWSISRATKDSARVGLYHRIKACRADSLSDCFAFCLVFVSTRGFVGTHFSFEPSDLLIARSRKEGHQTSGSRLRHPLSGKIQNATSPRSTLYVVVCVYTPIIYCKTQFLERFFHRAIPSVHFHFRTIGDLHPNPRRGRRNHGVGYIASSRQIKSAVLFCEPKSGERVEET